MAMTLRLSEEKDRALERMADSLHISKNLAAAEAITLAAPRPSHPDFVEASMRRQLSRYADLMTRLANA
jgi:predicted transcriptional regulator